MAFLDFIKNRQAGQQQSDANKSQDQKPETAKQMYTREAAQEKANRKPVLEQISETAKAKAREAGGLLDKATQHLQQSAPAQPSAPSEATGSPEAMRQKMMAQDKTAPALSPTSGQAGAPASEKGAPVPSKEPPAKPQEKPQQPTPRTVPRRAPSWER